MNNRGVVLIQKLSDQNKPVGYYSQQLHCLQRLVPSLPLHMRGANTIATLLKMAREIGMGVSPNHLCTPF